MFHQAAKYLAWANFHEVFHAKSNQGLHGFDPLDGTRDLANERIATCVAGGDLCSVEVAHDRHLWIVEAKCLQVNG